MVGDFVVIDWIVLLDYSDSWYGEEKSYDMGELRVSWSR